MAGHSKWANIKRQKARVDAVKGKVFTRISRELIIAARSGTDPTGNFQLRTAIEKAKAAGIPNDNIERAIAKGAGTYGSENAAYESIRYEGYGPGGVAILIEALTDNRNRTAADLRAAFSKNGGNLGETGCVGWMFDQKGVVEVTLASEDTGRKRRHEATTEVDEEKLLEAFMEGEADTYELIENEEGPVAEAFTAAANLEFLNQTLRDKGYNVSNVELRWIPNNTVEVNDSEQARSLLKLMDALEDLDDVQNVTANFEMTDELMDLSVA